MRVLYDPVLNYEVPTEDEILSEMIRQGVTSKWETELVINLTNYFAQYFFSLSPQLKSDWSEGLTEEERNEYNKLVDFFEKLDPEKFSGDSPLQKTAAVLKSVENAARKKDPNLSMLLLLQLILQMSSEEIEEMMEENEKMVESFSDSVLGSFFNSQNAPTPERAVANLTSRQRDVLNKLSVIKSNGRIKSHKKLAETKSVLMEEHSQISSLYNMSDRMLPTFGMKFAKKELNVREQKEANKQVLILLIDNSGSMTMGNKINWVIAICLDRLQAVQEGNAELIINWFLDSIYKTVVLKTKDDVKKFLASKYFGSFDGGLTNVQNCVLNAISEYQKLGLKSSFHPQIVVVNDGQDNIDPSITFPIETHGFLLGANANDSNCKLQQDMYIKSGGTFTMFD